MFNIYFNSFVFFFSVAYTRYLYSYSQRGSIYSGLYSCSLGCVREFLLLFLHWFPLNLIILKVDVAGAPPGLLYNGYRVFPGGKAAGAWRGFNQPPPSGPLG